MQISKLCEGGDVIKFINTDKEAEINHITNDYKTAGVGSLFFAISGEKTDGNKFISKVLQSGGVAVSDSETFARNHLISGGKNLILVRDVRSAMSKIAGNFNCNPQEKLRMIMIVGTNGKTSTACIIRDIFEYCGVRTGIIGTLETRFEDTIYKSEMTTPDPIELFEILSSMQKLGAKAVVMEASAHAIYLKKLQNITAEIAVFTNLTQDHLDFFSDMQSYKNAKKSLFTRENVRAAVVNADSETGREIISETNTPVLSYGIENISDVFCIFSSDMQKFTDKIIKAKQDSKSDNGIKFVVNYLDEICEISSNLKGKFNAYNLLAGITTARFFGLDFENIKNAVAKIKPIAGRYQTVENNREIEIVVDYAHTPDGMKNILEAMQCDLKSKATIENPNPKLITLFGCGGNRDSSKRAIMGGIAEEFSSAIVITSDNPRFEDPQKIAGDILCGIKTKGKAIIVLDRESAIANAISMCNAGDSLAILGKGHEDYIETNGKKEHFSDIETVQKYI
ncbi:MAG: UDP-N-acetylmuramoyl-L-alanyl-D-glutamate--2,6-diaminopimelate ligase [Bacillota bacterium]